MPWVAKITTNTKRFLRDLSPHIYTEHQKKRPQTKFSIFLFSIKIWAAPRQNQQNDCVPSEDSDQPGHAYYMDNGELSVYIYTDFVLTSLW